MSIEPGAAAVFRLKHWWQVQRSRVVDRDSPCRLQSVRLKPPFEGSCPMPFQKYPPTVSLRAQKRGKGKGKRKRRVTGKKGGKDRRNGVERLTSNERQPKVEQMGNQEVIGSRKAPASVTWMCGGVGPGKGP